MAEYIIKAHLQDHTVHTVGFPTLESFLEAKEKTDSREPFNFLSGALRPVRTDSLINFSKDFFFPTTVNYAFKVNSIVVKLFAIMAALAFDIATLPIRLVTFIPRVRNNSQVEEHPFRVYLRSRAVNEAQLPSTSIVVEMTWDAQGDTNLCQDPTKTYRNRELKRIHFIDIPRSEAPYGSNGFQSTQI